MKLPICQFCAKTKILCPRDLKRLEEGEISELDVDLSHDLLELAEKYPELDKLEFVKASRYAKLTILLVRGLRQVSREVLIRVSRALERKGYGKVRFVEFSKNAGDVVVQVLSPCRVIGVDVLWLPDGSTEYTVRVKRRDARRLPLKKREVEKLLEELLGKPVRIVFV